MCVAGEIFGWDHKFSVLIIDYLHKDLADTEKKEKIENSIKKDITKAVNKALEYKYSSIDEFLEQLKWEIDKQFDEEDMNFEFEEIDKFYTKFDYLNNKVKTLKGTEKRAAYEAMISLFNDLPAMPDEMMVEIFNKLVDSSVSIII